MIHIKDYTIYLAGGMGDLTFEESNEWRRCLKEKILSHTKDINSRVVVKNPNEYFNFIFKFHETESEVKNFDLNLVRKSDLVIVNFNDPHSIGTSQELAVANEYRIPVIGLNVDRYNIHPWLKLSCERIFDDMDKLLEYVKNYYLR